MKKDQENKIKMLDNIKNGKALKKFEEMVKNQGGDTEYLENTSKFPRAKYIEAIKAKQSGYIQEINAEEVGKVACNLGAGRIRKEDKIDNTVGVKLCKKVSYKVEVGEELAYIYANKIEKLQTAKKELEKIIKISNNKIEEKPTILEIYK